MHLCLCCSTRRFLPIVKRWSYAWFVCLLAYVLITLFMFLSVSIHLPSSQLRIILSSMNVCARATSNVCVMIWFHYQYRHKIDVIYMMLLKSVIIFAAKIVYIVCSWVKCIDFGKFSTRQI